ncbi:MAG: nucleotide pyrophosphohydrolase [Bacteroidetes bacterium]|nr:nucleotide pyrophosphohydrolase [Bacteroidota bacterium]MBS1629033.1 nucleotide pyrophosphohydrolase [Bacteroidota bacterium]
MTPTLSLSDAQAQVDSWIRRYGVRYFSELTNLGILMEEVGELSRILVRRYGDQSFKEQEAEREAGDELADVLWVLLCLANQTGVNLTEAFLKNMEKKTQRDAQRHLNNEKLRG